MPFKSDKQKTYLAINEPEVYKKFKKEENMYKVKKRAKGGKVDISRSSKKSGGRKGAHKKTAKYGGKVDNSGQHLVAKQYGGKVK